MMTSLASLQDDASFFCGRGFDLLDGTVSGAGAGAAFDLDFDVLGGNSMIGAGDLGMGSASSATAIVTQTGSANDTADLLLGASGTDTLGDAAGSLAATGCNTGLDVVQSGTGIDSLWSRDNVQAATGSLDLSVSLILHRIDRFSALAPARIGFRTGCAL